MENMNFQKMSFLDMGDYVSPSIQPIGMGETGVTAATVVFPVVVVAVAPAVVVI